MGPLAKSLVVGSSAVFASGFLPSVLPSMVDVGGLPVREWGSAVAGAWAAEKLVGGGASLWKSVLLGVTALGAAKLKDTMAPGLNLALPIVGEVSRMLAAGGGVYLAGHLNLEPKA